jgi:hypothetical protein
MYQLCSLGLTRAGLFVILAVGLLASPSAARAQQTGLCAVGLASYSDDDIKHLADLIVAAATHRPGTYEVSFPPQEYRPNKPYDQTAALAQSVLRRLPRGSTLRLTPRLYFHSNDPTFQWDAFTAQAPSRALQAFVNDYKQRVRACNVWIKNLRAYADRLGIADRLLITVSPYLEDDCPSAAAYTAILKVVQGQQQADGIAATGYRRSPTRNVFRAKLPGGAEIPLELHGRWADAKRSLRAGDTFSNDGVFVYLDAATQNDRATD